MECTSVRNTYLNVSEFEKSTTKVMKKNICIKAIKSFLILADNGKTHNHCTVNSPPIDYYFSTIT